VSSWSADPRIPAVAAALAPYAWRDLTERMLARRVLAAADRYRVVRLIQSVPGAAVGELGPMEPTGSGDVRVDVLVGALEYRLWRGYSVERLCAALLAALDAWQAERNSFDAGTLRLPDDR
jgi:hypothetical protein